MGDQLKLKLCNRIWAPAIKAVPGNAHPVEKQTFNYQSLFRMDEKEIQHTVTEQDIQNNPELTAQGVEVGEVIGIPVEDTDPPAEEGAALVNGPDGNE